MVGPREMVNKAEFPPTRSSQFQGESDTYTTTLIPCIGPLAELGHGCGKEEAPNFWRSQGRPETPEPPDWDWEEEPGPPATQTSRSS